MKRNRYEMCYEIDVAEMVEKPCKRCGKTITTLAPQYRRSQDHCDSCRVAVWRASKRTRPKRTYTRPDDRFSFL